MWVIANNIATRDLKVGRIFEQLKAGDWHLDRQPARLLRQLAGRCIAAGADAIEINLQQHHDVPEAMAAAVEAVQQVSDCQLCLSTNNAEVLEAGLRASKRPPLVNYVSADAARLTDILPTVARHNAEVVLLVSEASALADARQMLQRADVLVGAANEAGVPDHHIFFDPGLVHVTSDSGQRHLVEVKKFLRALPRAFAPPVKTTCWVANTSAGAPRDLRPVLERTALALLAGLGLSSVFWDVLDPKNMQALRLIRIFNNETIYAESEVIL